MRGGITYNEAMDMSVDERKIISEIIKENLEIAKKSNMPFFWDVLQTSVDFANAHQHCFIQESEAI